MIGKCIKSFGKYIWIFATLITIFMALMILGCIFPSEMIEKNVKESSKILSMGGDDTAERGKTE